MQSHTNSMATAARTAQMQRLVDRSRRLTRRLHYQRSYAAINRSEQRISDSLTRLLESDYVLNR
jgi:hypothetical protein